jgi:hypothetical protein
MRAVIVIVIGLLLLAWSVPRIMGHYFAGEGGETNAQAVMTWVWEAAAGETAEESRRPVMDALETFVASQKRFHSRHGRYTRDLTQLKGLPIGAAEATLFFGAGSSASSEVRRDFHGYLFATVRMNGATRMNYDQDFVVVAIPAFYPESGTETYAAGPRGIVLSRDTHGIPVDNATEFANGWIQQAN